MISWFKGYVLYAVVLLVALLMLVNIYLIYENNKVIVYSEQQQQEAERIKVGAGEVIRSLHQLDIGIRSYALVRKERFLLASVNALAGLDSVFNQLGRALPRQNFDTTKLRVLRDSVNHYVHVTDTMLASVRRGDMVRFNTILDRDPGYEVWRACMAFLHEVTVFENQIGAQAKARHERALRNSYLFHIVLFLFAIPTLAYTAFNTNKLLAVSDQLRQSESDRATLLAEQNVLLERVVQERTREIVAQNNEISAQNEEIVAHNEQLIAQQREIEKQHVALQDASRVIAEKNEFIQRKNRELADEVQRQTQDLKQSNHQLVEQNSRLEQFAFIISHNLRAPMARLIGLASIMDFAKSPDEAGDIVRLVGRSTQELDQVVKDLTLILSVQKISVKVFQVVSLDGMMNKVRQTLAAEMVESNATLLIDFSAAHEVRSLAPYIESILYNLVSNAIRYRDDQRPLEIRVWSALAGDSIQVSVADNGLGIDLARNRDNLFGLYKRFHYHVEGKGMGLYLVKTQVEALGGKIEVESREGHGTVFRIYLKNK